jgi:transglutaminase superfamily protein
MEPTNPPKAADVGVSPRNLAATPIYDLQSYEVQALADVLRRSQPDDRGYVQAAHRHLSDANMKTVYSINDDQPASVTLRESKGSCVQRMAALEALARAVGIATRVRALWQAKRFWYHRLPLLKWGLPDSMLYTWPQFRLGKAWVDFDELYEPMESMVAKATRPFSNAGESVFSAVRDQPVDFLGKSPRCGHPEFDLSPIVTADGGLFDTRDELLAKLDHKPEFFGRLLFNLLYAGKPIRRVAE